MYRKGNDTLRFFCMDLADNNIKDYEKYYKNYSIGYVMELLTLKKVSNYNEPARKK